MKYTRLPHELHTNEGEPNKQTNNKFIFVPTITEEEYHHHSTIYTIPGDGLDNDEEIDK
jgi:hypothetical protein